jgi:hypothetical protein
MDSPPRRHRLSFGQRRKAGKAPRARTSARRHQASLGRAPTAGGGSRVTPLAPNTDQWCAYSVRRYRISAHMATTITKQYAPHCALLVTPNQTRHRKGITGRTMAAAIS